MHRSNPNRRFRGIAATVVVIGVAMTVAGCASQTPTQPTPAAADSLPSSASRAPSPALPASAPASAPATAENTPTIATAPSVSVSKRTVLPGTGPSAVTSPTPPTAATTGGAAPAVSEPLARTSLDPCQFVTASEASALARAKYGAGQHEATDAGETICVYGAQTKSVFTVGVVRTTSAALADQAWSAEMNKALAELQQSPTKPAISSVAGLADRAETVTLSIPLGSASMNVAGIYLLRGATFAFFSIVATGSTAVTAAQLVAQGRVSLARLP